MDVSACIVGAELIGLSDARAPWPRSAQSFGPRSPRAWEAQSQLTVAKPGPTQAAAACAAETVIARVAHHSEPLLWCPGRAW